jgi:RNA polymerase sigma-70 factor (ECF subfamily)
VQPTTELNDAELVAKAMVGERWAFEQLYRRHVDFAFGLAIRLQGGPTDVEDLVHDAFLKAHSQLASLRDRAAFRSWLGSIVVSLVRMRLRRGRLLRVFGLSTSDPVDLESLASPSAGPEVRAELAQLYALLRVLPADERIAWTLRHVQHHQLEDVARLAECSLATAKRRIQRAQRFLRDHFVPPANDGADVRADEDTTATRRKGGRRGQ